MLVKSNLEEGTTAHQNRGINLYSSSLTSKLTENCSSLSGKTPWRVTSDLATPCWRIWDCYASCLHKSQTVFTWRTHCLFEFVQLNYCSVMFVSCLLLQFFYFSPPFLSNPWGVVVNGFSQISGIYVDTARKQLSITLFLFRVGDDWYYFINC